ncbi:MAG: DUF5652 family protein [Patescibacteria group bacterium]|nr:DUF5652 family protein [Patescibacteria group bacterium]
MENFSLADLQKLVWLLVILSLWAIPWKAMALWRSARKGQVGWFILFILVNTLGVVEIIYLTLSGGIKAEGLKETWSALKSKLVNKKNTHSNHEVNHETENKTKNKSFDTNKDETKQKNGSEDLNARKILMEERKEAEERKTDE